MRTPLFQVVCLVSAVGLAACGQSASSYSKKDNPEKSAINVVDATNLNDIMLTIADPNDAVNYFKGALEKEPDRVLFQRGLATSLVRAKRATEAIPVYKKLLELDEATHEDRINFADALIRSKPRPSLILSHPLLRPLNVTGWKRLLQILKSNGKRQIVSMKPPSA